MKASKRSGFFRIIAVCVICALDLLCGAGYLYFVKETGGTLLSVKYASGHLSGLFAQGLITTAFPLVLFLLFLCILRKDFFAAMYLRVYTKKQAVTAAALVFVLAGMTAVCLTRNADKAAILYNLFYYLVLIAFTEEFVVRGVCVYLLRDFPRAVRYLLPNAAFGLMHIFAYANYEALTPSYVLHFLTSNLLGLIAAGCFFQFLKEKSGTLWIPVLLHAICDYSVIFTY